MKRFSKIFTSLLVAFVIIFNTAACDVLANIPGIDSVFNTGESGDGNKKPGGDSIIEPGDTEVKPGNGSSDGSDEDPDNSGDPSGDTGDGDTSSGNGTSGDNGNSGDNGTGDNDGDFSDPDDPTGDPEYVFGSEYADLIIPVSEALEKAEEYTSKASDEIYYILVKIDYILDLGKGNMYVFDDTGFIYVYGAKDSNGNSLSGTDIAEGDIAVISGPLRNYKGELEIERGNVLAFYTPGEDTEDNPSGTNPGGSGTIVWPTPDDPITSDPYVNVDVDAFYADYRPAVSYMDAYYRSKHYLMSGSIAEQQQAPTVSSYQPMQDGKYVRNTTYLYSADGNTYYVVNAYGEVVNEIYRGGAYVILEEVAAYVFAFGEPPANHSSSKSTKPSSSPWGIYLRVNHTNFSGDTWKYPYEPVLPNISGCGGDLFYYEMDIGTTGTDCDPSYPATDYNNGTSITRGAARIVYTRMDLDRDGVIEVNETFLFYTYNHYNDFQEYLNYEGGWGEMFGNITGGGTISSKYDYNPTDYVPTAYAAFVTEEVAYEVVVFCLPKREDV